jgi:prepilin-type N-terminal cleavage/methylation domain-containing protein
MLHCKRRRRGFSLVELVIVIVIIGIIAAIAVPRISRGAKGAKDSAMRGNLTVLRAAVDLYSAEHGGNFPAVTNDLQLLTGYSDEGGTYSATKTTTAIFGTYLKAIPPLPIAGVGTTGGLLGDTGVGAADALGVAWIYDAAKGDFTANTGTAKDEADVLYTDY